MTEQSTHDPERIVAAFREHHEQFLAAGRKTWLEAAESLEATLGAFADARDKLAEATELEWLAGFLHAQATFSRDVLGAWGRFSRELLTP
jgi:hypothetical protein